MLIPVIYRNLGCLLTSLLHTSKSSFIVHYFIISLFHDNLVLLIYGSSHDGYFNTGFYVNVNYSPIKRYNWGKANTERKK